MALSLDFDQTVYLVQMFIEPISHVDSLNEKQHNAQ